MREKETRERERNVREGEGEKMERHDVVGVCVDKGKNKEQLMMIETDSNLC